MTTNRTDLNINNKINHDAAPKSVSCEV